MDPFFSIITPVYNCRRFLKKCIQSVIDQTYESWELILIDDGSTDSSGEICDSFCQDSRIKVIHQDNSGAFASRINGIAAAKGIYGMGLDADDYLEKNCLGTVKKAIDISGSDLIFFGYRNVGNQCGCVRCGLEPGKEYPQREILKEVIGKTNHALWNKAIKIEKIRRADYSGIKKRLSINLDYAQIIPILCNVDTGYVVNEILYNYRVYGSSISHSCKVEHIFDTGLVTEYIRYKLKKALLMDPEMSEIINLAYLKMVGPRLRSLFFDGAVKKEDCRRIRKSKAYIRSKSAESLENFEKYDYVFLKLFRCRQYWALKLFAGLWQCR